MKSLVSNVTTLSFALFAAFSLNACGGGDAEPALVPAPNDIAQNALACAHEYAERETEYVWGGQDPLRRALQIDCSGLVVNCYGYAVEGTDYRLPFVDAAVINFYQRYTDETDSPRPGDLIFMRNADADHTDPPTHIAIFEKIENGTVYFVDATEITEDGVNGVSPRHYPIDSPKIMSYGMLLLEDAESR
jgi:hypothetical protein